jgi:hypothetical protein
MLLLIRKPGESIILEISKIDPITISVMENGKIGIDAEDCVDSRGRTALRFDYMGLLKMSGMSGHVLQKQETAPKDGSLNIKV